MYSQYLRLNCHVMDSNRTVIARASRQMIRKGARFNRDCRESRHAWLRSMLRHHKDAIILFFTVTE